MLLGVIRGCWALWLVLASTLAAAAAHGLPEPRFESVGVGSIPRGVVATMAQDRAGFLWIATGDGLVRYDGYRFRPQGREAAAPAERNLGWVRALLAARDGSLWIGTETDGLGHYDPHSDRVSLRRSDGLASDGRPKPPALPTIRALAEDRDGAIWVGSMGGGLQRYEPASARFQQFSPGDAPGSLPDDRVLALLVDRQGTLWVGSWTGLSRKRAGSSVFEPVPFAAAPRGRQVQALLEAEDGRIWAGTQQGGLVVVDPADGQARPLDSAALGAVSSFVQAPGGPVWVGRAAGLSLYDAQSGRLLQTLRHDPGKPSGLRGVEVTGLLLDHAGWIWVSGYGLGLQRHNPGNRSMWVRGADNQPGSPLADADVRSLLQLREGGVLAASHVGPVALLDEQLRVRRAVESGLGRVSAMAQAGDGSVWMAGDGQLSQLDRKLRPLRLLAHGGGPARRLLAGMDGSLWLSADDGLYRLAPGAAALQRVGLADGQPLAGEVHALAEAPDGALWVGAAHGLFRLPAGGERLQPVQAAPGHELGNPVVIGLLFDRQQRLWLDTAVAGLHRLQDWDGRQARFERVSVRHGMLGRPFGANLLEDERGRIWTHMHVYDPQQDRLDELTAADGASLGTGWFFSYAKANDGRLLFGGSRGVLVVQPEAFKASTFAPPLVVSELRVNGQPQQAGAVLAGLQIQPGQRSFSLEFAALDYADPGRLRYAYQLQGFDPDWIQTGAEMRVASYSNLNPGDYLLRVRATNRSGVWSAPERAIPVQVLPAWWQGLAFRFVLLLLAAALLWGLLHWRTRQLRLRQLKLEHKVLERTNALASLARELEQSSFNDPLTGLRNRRFLTQHIEADVARAQQGGADLIFFLVDIDHFKQVNDQHGHAAGDAVLRQMRERLQQVFREADYIVRWGGEEFLIVARGSARAHAAELAERAWAAVSERPFRLDDGSPLHKSCSVGFACFPLAPELADALDWTATLKVADAALYAVKRGGRNSWLGAVRASAASAEALRSQAQQPLQDWMASGGLQLASAAAPGGKI
jgi:diguanylate cyclase (GGDEF)-like protein